MQAIAHELLARKPDTRITSSAPSNYQRARWLNSKPDDASVPSTLPGTDLLLVDDVQFLKGKEATQEEFFHTLKAADQSCFKSRISEWGRSLVSTIWRPASYSALKV